MEALRQADHIVMKDLEERTEKFAKEDYQCLCALIDNNTRQVDIGLSPDFLKESSRVTNDKVTGMVNNQRTYTNMLLIDPSSNFETTDIINASRVMINPEKGIGRVAYLVGERRVTERGKYIAVLRSVLTKDFTEADVAPIERDDLEEIAHDLLLMVSPEVSRKINEVYYDVTSKPPATIEFE
jgi:GMP synthase PP-ATPase subunit